MRSCENCLKPLPENVHVCPACGHDDSLSKRDLPPLNDPLTEERRRKDERSRDLKDMFKLIAVMGLVAVGGYLGDALGSTIGMVVGVVVFLLFGLVIFFR